MPTIFRLFVLSVVALSVVALSVVVLDWSCGLSMLRLLDPKEVVVCRTKVLG